MYEQHILFIFKLLLVILIYIHECTYYVYTQLLSGEFIYKIFNYCNNYYTYSINTWDSVVAV